MIRRNRIEFCVKNYRRPCKWHGVVPVVDGVSLITLVRNFEKAQGFDLPGSYGGINPSWGRTENWVRYLLGESFPEDGHPSNGITWLLGCSCSVAGCWPLEAHVTVERDRVMWHGFRQPHRPAQDYAAFGPFAFARENYEVAFAKLAADLAASFAQQWRIAPD
jgi:hypothetical protein